MTPGVPVATTGGGTTIVNASSSSRDVSNLPSVQSYLMYSTDSFTGQIVGLYQDDDFGSADWAIGGGAKISLTKGFDFIAAAVVGEGTATLHC